MARSDTAAETAAETAEKAEAGVDGECRADSSEECNNTPVVNLQAKAAAPPPSPKDFIVSVARKIAEQVPQSFGPGVWGVLTAISSTARKRPQGMNIILDRDEHCFGRLVDDPRFHIDGFAVSARHCKIYRTEDADTPSGFSIFLKDHSTNGTFLNWEKVTKHVPEVRMQHGDIVSFIAPPHREVAVAFVYREVFKNTSLENKTAPKRKLDNFGPESKRQKGLGIGAPEGPVSLDDVRSLQHSNTELRKQLESHVHEIEAMRNKNLAAVARHDQELKMLKETVTSSFLDQTKELQRSLEIKQKEFDELSAVAIERQQAVEDLNKRLTVSVQSRMDADEIINSQKSTITELEAQLTEERSQRRKEREKALEDLKSALEKMKSELQEELTKQSDAALKQQKELQEVISKLQEADKEGRALAEMLRSKLEDTRESLVMSEKGVRQLEAQLHVEQLAAANARKKAETMEMQAKKLRKEVEREKVAREEAWAKVSALELEISAAIRDLTIEKQRFQGARERIILRETQLRAFYSTTEEIAALFAKQQEQLKAMQKALEDGENCETASVDIDLDTIKENLNGALGRERTDSQPRGNTVRGTSAVSKLNDLQGSSGTYSDDDSSATVKHNYDHKSQEDGDTQEMECTSADPSARGFVSDMDRAGKAPVRTIDLNCKSQEVGNTGEKEYIKADCSVSASGFERDGICGGPVVNADLNCPSQEEGDTQVMDNADCSVKGFGLDVYVVGRDPIQNLDLNDTERVLVSESQAHDNSLCKRDFSLRKCSNKNLGGDIMQRDDEARDQEAREHQRDGWGANEGEGLRNLEDTEACSIKTADLLTSEVAGSWAVNTASDHVGENEYPGSDDELGGSNEQAGTLLCRSDVQAAGSQTHPPVVAAAPNLNHERRALNQMIGIVAPDMEDRFPVETENELKSGSDSETEVGCGSSSDDDNDKMNVDDNEDNEDDDATQQLQEKWPAEK